MDVQRWIERLLFASRWLLCPLYVGLGLLLLVFAIQFAHELWYLFQNALGLSEVDVILATLTLVDLTLVASLVVMVMLSGYENFVSRLDIAETDRNIAWLGKLDAGSLKLKIAAAIVTISAVQLLKEFMEARAVPNDKLLLMALIHLAFVATALLLTLMDRLTSAGHKGS
jgi:uncharacterized protein (TIGR00645 family)